MRCHAGVWLVNKAGLPLAFRRRVGGAGKVAQHRSVGEEVTHLVVVVVSSSSK